MGDVFRRGTGWSIRWYEGGRRRVLASRQSSHADARRMLLEIEARVARGEVGISERSAPAHTVAELIELFVRDYSRPKLKDPARYRYVASSTLKRVLPYLGKRLIESLTAEDIARLRDSLGKKFAPGTVKLTQNILGSMFAWAVRQGLAKTNPCRGVERPAQPSSLDFLSHAEARALLDATARPGASHQLGRMLHIAVAIALHTGLRKGEILGLRWVDVDLDTRRLTVAKSYKGTPKNSRTRHLRLPLELVPLLRGWREECPPSPAGSILPLGRGTDGVGTSGSMLGLPRIMAELGLRPVLHPWHMLRHTFASHYVMAGGNLLALQKILGHSDLKVTMLYAHLAPDFLDGEMDRVKF